MRIVNTNKEKIIKQDNDYTTYKKIKRYQQVINNFYTWYMTMTYINFD